MSKINILYIEDEDSQRKKYSKLLRSKGFSVRSAPSGHAGLHKFEKNHTDVILCDLNMPGMNGLEVLKQIQQINSDIPFIITTAHGSIPLAIKAIKQGAYDFILKPLEINEIKTTIQKAIEKTNLEKALRKSQTSLQMIMENVPDIIYSLNPKGEFLSVSPAGEAILGYKPSEMLGTSVFNYIYSEDLEKVKAGFEQAMKTADRTVKTIEFRMVSKSGEVKDFEVNRRLVFEKGKIIRQDGIIRDVTKRKQLEDELKKYSQALENIPAYQSLERKVIERTKSLRDTNRELREKAKELENTTYSLGKANVKLLSIQEQLEKKNAEMENLLKALSESKNRLEAILDSSLSAIIMVDHEDNVIAGNRRIQEFFGLKFQEILNENIEVFLNNIKPCFEDFEEFQNYIEEMQLNSYHVYEREVKLLRPEPRFLSLYCMPVLDKNNNELGKIWTFNDITERQEAGEALRESEERFRGIVENANDIIYSLTTDGVFSYVSPNWTDILGHEVSEVQGKSFKPFVHPDDLPACDAFLQKVVETGEKQSGIEYRTKHKDGSWRWHTTSASTIKDKDGRVLHFIGIARDITENKKVLDDLEQANQHLRETQAQLVQSEKMASLGMLVAGIAHEINTPIGAIHSMHDTLMRAMKKVKSTLAAQFPEDYKDNRELNASLDIIEDANRVIESGCERVTNIVRRLRSFARLDEAELKTADIHEGLEDTLTLIHHEIKHNIKVIKNYGDIPPIACFPGRLNQVFLNIFINAKQAIKDKGKIAITTFQKENKVYIEIKDSGIGIPKEKLIKIYDPGYTTKGVGVGTGLGLSIVYRIIQDHQGEIKVDSEVGKGSTFTIILPMNLDKMLEKT